MSIKTIALILVAALLNLSGLNLVTSHANSASHSAVAALPTCSQTLRPLSQHRRAKRKSLKLTATSL